MAAQEDSLLSPITAAAHRSESTVVATPSLLVAGPGPQSEGSGLPRVLQPAFVMNAARARQALRLCTGPSAMATQLVTCAALRPGRIPFRVRPPRGPGNRFRAAF